MLKANGEVSYYKSEVVRSCPNDSRDMILAPKLRNLILLSPLEKAFIDAGFRVIVECVHCGLTDLLTPPLL